MPQQSKCSRFFTLFAAKNKAGFYKSTLMEQFIPD
jgi:hypothetical protein